MKAIKHFTYWVLLIVPLSLFINFRYGAPIQWAWTAGFIYAVFVPFIAQWMAKKF